METQTTTQIIRQFPAYAEPLKQLVSEHLELTDEPLALAIYYDSGRNSPNVCLFEVHQNFGRNAVDPDRELFEVSYGSTSGFPMDNGQRLHLVLTNPVELKTALAENWPLAAEVRDAVKGGKAQVLFTSPAGAQCLEWIRE